MASSERDIEAEIRQLLARGQKLEAVKRFREAADVSLMKAKRRVEEIERGRVPQYADEPLDDPLDDELLRLLRQGRKLQAVKLYRRRSGATLMQSKQAVEELAQRHGLVIPGRGCGAAVLALVLLAASMVAALAGALVRAERRGPEPLEREAPARPIR